VSKQANTVAIGAFVAGAFLILFGLLFYLSGNVFNRNTQQVLMVFDGSVKGLKIGAPIAFKGVEIGQVTDFDVIVDSDSFNVLTPVVVRVYTDRIKHTGEDKGTRQNLENLIARGLRAQLQLQSLLTGLLYVELDFYPERPARFTAEALAKYDVPTEYAIVPTIPTELERLSQHLEGLDIGSLAKSLQDTLQGIDGFVNDPDIHALPEKIGTTLAAVEQLSNTLDAEIQAISPSLNGLVADAGGAMETLNRELPEISTETQAALAELASVLTRTQTTLANVDYLLSDDSAVVFEVSRAAQELAAAGRALRSLAETLETQPESIFKGKSPLRN
jgi:paraquat-inducible protein B